MIGIHGKVGLCRPLTGQVEGGHVGRSLLPYAVGAPGGEMSAPGNEESGAVQPRKVAGLR